MLASRIISYFCHNLLEPAVGLEPTTARLQIESSTN